MGSRRGGGHGRGLPEFEWDEHNEDKLLRNHGVSAAEAEQCFANSHPDPRRVADAMLMLGITDCGRMLLLVYEQKPDGIVRVYSAREQTGKERRTFRRLAR
ncbi:MAG: BrnT family toxin [Candidatus Dormibacteria bacterium]